MYSGMKWASLEGTPSAQNIPHWGYISPKYTPLLLANFTCLSVAKYSFQLGEIDNCSHFNQYAAVVITSLLFKLDCCVCCVLVCFFVAFVIKLCGNRKTIDNYCTVEPI